MSSKQDLVAARTASDIERKYNFGKTFAEFIGIAEEAQKAAEKAEEIVDGLDQDKIFNILTNNGEEQGVYRENGKIYINASYIKTGEFMADLITSGMLSSSDGRTYFDLDNGYILSSRPISDSTVYSHYVFMLTPNGFLGRIVKHDGSWGELFNVDLNVYGIDSNTTSACTISDGVFNSLRQGLAFSGEKISFGNASTALTSIDGNKITIGGKTVSWKDNGDGTYSLIGQ